MKLINKLADRALDRLAPSSHAKANDCWWADCGGGCVRRCCPTTGCSSLCACP